MIARHIPMGTVNKSSYKRLVEYLTSTKENENINERVAATNVAICHSLNVNDAVLEVINTQQQNKRSEADKTYHLIISFRKGEIVDKDTLKKIENKICESLGFSDHQRVSVLHVDTENLHIHVAINKIHPTKLTNHTPFNDYITLAKVCNELEDVYNLEKDNHKFIKRTSEAKAQDMEKFTGQESLLTWIKNEVLDDILNANSWSDLHGVLAVNDLRVKPRANGLIFESSSGITVKASSVDRALSKKRLEERLGVFVDTDINRKKKPKKKYEAKPINLEDAKTKILYENYLTYKKNNLKINKNEIERKRKYLIEQAKKEAKLKREGVKNFFQGKVSKRILYTKINSTLSEKIQKIHKECNDDYNGRKISWLDWLRQEVKQGNKDALKAIQIIDKRNASSIISRKYKVSNVTKKGLLIYRTHGGVIKDDGNKINVSSSFNHEGLKIALELSIEKYGKKVKVTGSNSFKDQIILVAVKENMDIQFSDPELDRKFNKVKEIINDRLNSRRTRPTESIGSIGTRGLGSRRGISSRIRQFIGLKSKRRGDSAVERQNDNSTIFNMVRESRGTQTTIARGIHRLRTMSLFRMVRDNDKSGVLLSSNERSNLESKRGNESINNLRWIVYRANTKLEIFDIMNYMLYNRSQNNSSSSKLFFEGIVEQVDEKNVYAVLHSENNEKFIYKVTLEDVNKMKNWLPGKEVIIQENNEIVIKGRSR